MDNNSQSALVKLAENLDVEEMRKEALSKLVKGFKNWRGARSMAKSQAQAAKTTGARQMAEESGKNWAKMNPQQRGEAINKARTPAEAPGKKLTGKQIAGGAAGAAVAGDVLDPAEKLTGKKKDDKTINITKY